MISGRRRRHWLLPIFWLHWGAAAAAGPALEVKCQVEVVTVWDDTGSGSPHHVTFYAAPAQGAFQPVGVGAERPAGHQRSSTRLCLVKDISPKGDALALPVGYRRVWWDRASGARRDGAIWAPKCPAHYVGIGFAVQASYRMPEPSAIRCVHEDLTVAGVAALDSTAPEQLAGSVYADWGTLAVEDLSVWRVKAAKGFDVGAVFAWGTRDVPQRGQGVRLLDRTQVRELK